jgi:hypothetical protein
VMIQRAPLEGHCIFSPFPMAFPLREMSRVIE